MHTRAAQITVGAIIALTVPVAAVYVYRTEDRLCYAPASLMLGKDYGR